MRNTAPMPLDGLTTIETAASQDVEDAIDQAVGLALVFAAGITDIVIQEGRPMMAKSAQGVLPLHVLVPAVAEFNVTKQHIVHYLAGNAAAEHAGIDAQAYWDEHLKPRLDRRLPVNTKPWTAGHCSRVRVRATPLSSQPCLPGAGSNAMPCPKGRTHGARCCHTSETTFACYFGTRQTKVAKMGSRSERRDLRELALTPSRSWAARPSELPHLVVAIRSHPPSIAANLAISWQQTKKPAWGRLVVIAKLLI